MLHAYYAGMTPEPRYGTIKEQINTAEYGFTTFLNMVYDQIISTIGSPLNVIAVAEGGKVYRKTLYAEYKSNRDKTERDPIEIEEIEKLEGYIKNFLASQGVPLCRVAGVEADDLIAYLVQRLHGHKVVYTVDQDLIALASNDCTVMYRLNPVTNMKGIPPSCITINKTLVGDTSDNYPGIKGFGPKAWETLVESFGYDGMEQLTELLAKTDRQTLLAIGKQTNVKAYHKIIENMEHLFLMYRLAKLAPELCEGAKVKIEWYKRAPTLSRLHAVMDRAGCMDLAHRYEGDCFKATLVTKDNLDSVIAEIKSLKDETPFVAWDYETWDPIKNPNYKEAANGRDYVDMLSSKVAGCSFAVGRNAANVFYFSSGHKDTNNVEPETILEVIKYLEESNIPMVAQNCNFEGTITRMNFGHKLKYWEDTKLYAHHVDENDEVGLKHLSKKYLNYDQVSYKKTLEVAGASDMSEISGLDVLSYGADDSLVTAHIYQHLTVLTQLEGTYDFIQKYECPAAQLLVEAHISGVKLDKEEMARQTAADKVTARETMDRIRELLAIHATNPNFEGVDMLINDQKDYLSYKAKEAFTSKNPDSTPAEIQGAVAATLADYKQKLKENSYYQPLVVTKKFKEFINTKAGINKVLELLGLPLLESLTKEGVSDYFADNKSTQHEFLDLFRDAYNDNAKGANNWKAKTGDKYQALASYSNALLEANGKESFTGTELNLGSPIQNQYLFYLLLGLPIRKRTKVLRNSLRERGGFLGSPATDESAVYFAIANDCADHPWKRELLETLLVHKEATTRLGNYWRPYPLWIDDNDIMHPGFSSCGTVTRRPTGTNPNLLQVSKGDVRDVFIPRSDENVIVSMDFASEELRVLAALTEDPTLMSAYTGETDLDLHALTACGLVPLFLYKYPEVDPSEIQFDEVGKVDYSSYKAHQDDDSKLGKMLKTVRGYGKTANFGVGYGAGPDTISQQLMIPIGDAELIVEGMAQTYPGIAKWKSKINAFAKRNGYVATEYLSRRHCGNGLNTGDQRQKSRWERQLSNYMIQGVCADMLKVTMCDIIKSGVLERYNAYLIAVIYDEVLLEVPKKYLFEVITSVSDSMEIGIPGMSIPMIADTSFGLSWGTQVEVGRRPSRELIQSKLEEL
jgi:DNA polymerase I-like protein with 3'-5' exonuclease and polymerase domains